MENVMELDHDKTQSHKLQCAKGHQTDCGIMPMTVLLYYSCYFVYCSMYNVHCALCTLHK